MRSERMRVLEALAWSERSAETILSDLDSRGFVQDNTGDLRSGWLTKKGRSCVRDQ